MSRTLLLGLGSVVLLVVTVRLIDYYWYNAAGGVLEFFHQKPELAFYYPALDNLPNLLTTVLGTMLVHHFGQRPALLANARQEAAAEAIFANLQVAIADAEQQLREANQQQAVEMQDKDRLHVATFKTLKEDLQAELRRIAQDQAIYDRMVAQSHADEVTALKQQQTEREQKHQAALAAKERTIQQQAGQISQLQHEWDTARNQNAADAATIAQQQTTIQIGKQEQAAVERNMRAMLAGPLAELRATLLNQPAVQATPHPATVAPTVLATWTGRDRVLQLWQMGEVREWRIIGDDKDKTKLRIATPAQAAMFSVLYDLAGGSITSSELAAAATALGTEVSYDAAKQHLNRFGRLRGILQAADGGYLLPLPVGKQPDSKPRQPADN